MERYRFKNSAFIRKVTDDLLKKIVEIGYTIDNPTSTANSIATSYVTSTAVLINSDSFDCDNPHRTWNCGGRIDCGEDEELFLKLISEETE